RMQALGQGRGQRRRRGLLCMACCLSVALLGGCQEEKAKTRPLLPVIVQPVKLVKFTPKVTLTGEISARVQSDLSFRVGGRIIERNVEVGAHVEAAEAKLRQVTSNFERQKELLKTGFTTQRDYDRAEQEYRSAQALLDSAKA